MRKYRVFFFFALAACVCTGWAQKPDNPTKVIRRTTDAVLKTVTDPVLSAVGKKQERRAEMMRITNDVFDWPRMARSSMGRNWRKLDEKQREEFIPAFKELIMTAYLGHVEGYSGEKIEYKNERVEEGKFGEVTTVISTKEHGDIDIIYRMWLRDGEWRVRDVSVLGVSLVRNYRTQFSTLMRKGTFEEMMVKLRKKIEKQRVEGTELKGK
ncbi:MAG: ABC transporter substrate-binding protein [Lentisphaeria bacterium]|nr:ABC transporter substrate-binding protein [Lentisphaeria bacterium]